MIRTKVQASKHLEYIKHAKGNEWSQYKPTKAGQKEEREPVRIVVIARAQKSHQKTVNTPKEMNEVSTSQQRQARRRKGNQ